MAKNKSSGKPAGAGSPEGGGPIKPETTEEARPKFKVKEVSPEELEELREEQAADEEPELQEDNVDLSQQDFCPVCALQANGGAFQVRVPVPNEQGMLVVPLPLVVCIRCGTAYSPASFRQKILDPQPESNIVLARPNVIVP